MLYKADTIFDSIYPLTITADRYGGVYSGGDYMAWNLDPCDVPTEPFADDVTCMEFWYGEDVDVITGERRSDILCGVGGTPEEAVANLYFVLKRKENTDD